MRISVIIASRNRAGQLAQCLSAFEQVCFSDAWEMVVVDNGSTDDTPRLLAERKKITGFELVSCLETTPGTSAARNCGVNNSRGEILVFTDDDCYPAVDYLECVDQLFNDHPEVGFGGGRVLLYDSSDLPLTLQTNTSAQALSPGAYLAAGTIHGANIAFRREVFMALNGFDEDLGPGNFFRSGEDTDLLRRALFCGYTGYYKPNLVVYHHHGRKTATDRKRLHHAYDRGTGAGFMKQLGYRPDTGQALKVFWWHLRTIPWHRRMRQLWFFLLYGTLSLTNATGVNAHRSQLRSEHN